VSAKKWTLALALGLCLGGCSSEEAKSDEGAKTEQAAKAEKKKEALLGDEIKADTEIVIAMDHLAQRGGVELILEADVFGALSAEDIQELNKTYTAEQWREALDDLAKRAKRELVEEQREGRKVLRITK